MAYKEDVSKTAYDIQPFDLVVIAGLVYRPSRMIYDESSDLIEFEFVLDSVGEDYNAPEPFNALLTIPAKARMDTVVRI